MNRIRIGLTAIVALSAFSIIGVTYAQRNQDDQKSHPSKDDEATPIQKGVMTERQREHSKLYNGLGSPRKIVDWLKTQNELHIGFYPPLYVGQTNSTPASQSHLVSRATCESDAAITGKVVSKESQLSDDGSYVFTDYTIEVETVLKNGGSKPIRPHDSIIFSMPGGKVSINGHIVSVDDPDGQRLIIREKYLLFLKSIPTTGAFQAAFNTDIVPANRNESVERKYKRPNSIEVDLPTAIELVKSYVSAPCSKKQ